MKNFINLITNFVLLYPLLMAIFWTIGGIIHKIRKKEVPEANEEMALIILIPIYNEAENIKEHLEHNLNLDYLNYQIHAIDDCSTDNSAQVIKAISDPKLKFYQNEENLGKAKTLNKMVDKITTDYFIVIDSDTKLAHNALKRINDEIQQDILDEKQDEIAGYTGNITVHAEHKNKVFHMQKIEYRAFIDMIKRSQSVALKGIMTLSGYLLMIHCLKLQRLNLQSKWHI